MHFIYLVSEDRMDLMIVIFFTTIACLLPIGIGYGLVLNWWTNRKRRRKP